MEHQTNVYAATDPEKIASALYDRMEELEIRITGLRSISEMVIDQVVAVTQINRERKTAAAKLIRQLREEQSEVVQKLQWYLRRRTYPIISLV